MRFGTWIVLLGLLVSCGKPEQFDRVFEDPNRVIRDRNCQPGGKCVAIISHSTLDAKYLPLTIDNHRRYASTLGYDYIFRNNLLTTRFVDEYAEKKVFQLGLYWQKIQALQEAMDEMDGDQRRYKWLLWIDADALFTNFEWSIEEKVKEHAGDFENPTHYFMASREPFSFINAGVLLFHNDEASRKMIDVIARAFPWYVHQSLPEQDAISDYIAGFLTEPRPGDFRVTPIRQRDYKNPDLLIAGTKRLTQRALNSFYGGWWPWAASNDVVWAPGDFVAHFAVVKDKGKEIDRFVKCLREKGGEDYEKTSAYKACE